MNLIKSYLLKYIKIKFVYVDDRRLEGEKENMGGGKFWWVFFFFFRFVQTLHLSNLLCLCCWLFCFFFLLIKRHCTFSWLLKKMLWKHHSHYRNYIPFFFFYTSNYITFITVYFIQLLFYYKLQSLSQSLAVFHFQFFSFILFIYLNLHKFLFLQK